MASKDSCRTAQNDMRSEPSVEIFGIELVFHVIHHTSSTGMVHHPSLSSQGRSLDDWTTIEQFQHLQKHVPSNSSVISCISNDFMLHYAVISSVCRIWNSAISASFLVIPHTTVTTFSKIGMQRPVKRK